MSQKYKGVITRAEWGSSKKKGTPELRIYFEVEGSEQYTSLYYTDKSSDMFHRRLKAAGWDGDEEKNPPQFSSEPVDFVLKEEMWEGKPRLKWEIDLPTDMAPLDMQVRKRIAAQFRAATGTKPPAKMPTPTPPPAPTPPTPPAFTPPPPVSKKTASSRDDVWAKVCEAYPNDHARAEKEYLKRVEEVCAKYNLAEPQLTPQHWQEVSDLILPF